MHPADPSVVYAPLRSAARRWECFSRLRNGIDGELRVTWEITAPRGYVGALRPIPTGNRDSTWSQLA